MFVRIWKKRMNKIKKLTKKIFYAFFCVICLLSVFSSCSKSSKKKSFISSLNSIDALIQQGFYSDAVNEISKLEKTAFNSWTQLGIVKRYLKLSETDRAQKFLLECLKKNPENLEIRSVLTNLYLEKKDFDNAVFYGKELKGSKFGSLYSEAVFSKVLNSEKDSSALFSMDFYSEYFDAYQGSKNQAWLVNCALLNLISGNYESAKKLSPENAENPFFWALCNFDAEDYGNSIFYSDIALSSNKHIDLKLDSYLTSILSDCYVFLSDYDSAEVVRENFIERIQNSSSYDYPELPVILTNSAVWNFDKQNYESAFDLILLTLNNFPDFFPALSVYADFSYKTDVSKTESFQQRELRDYGMASLEMEKYDNRLKIPFSDVVFRVNKSLEKLKTPELYLLSYDLKYKNQKNYSVNEKTSDLYKMIERNSVENEIPSVLLTYAVQFLISVNKLDEAWNLLSKSVCAKYGFDEDENFWKNVILNSSSIEFLQLEFLAYFAALKHLKREAFALYEHCVYECYNSEEDFYISAQVSDESCINLSDIYFANGELDKALKLYAKLTGRVNDSYLKSLIYYRISMIYFSKKDFFNAKLNADYAVSINSRNVEAKFLLSQIENKK